MIYLFNSVSRPIYARNVLNTLFLPAGSTNEYRYTLHGEHVNIDAALVPEFLKTPSNEPIAVVFIDRHGCPGRYVYHPLRLGRFEACEKRDVRLYFTVRLDQYVCPKDLEAFNDRIRGSLAAHGLPKLTNDDPFNFDDGYYAIRAESIFDDTEFLAGDCAWDETAKHLSDVPAFASIAPRDDRTRGEDDSRREFLFLRCALLPQAGAKGPLEPDLVENQSAFTLRPATEYRLRLTYYYPPQKLDSASEAAVTVTHGENLVLLGDPRLHVSGLGNTVDVPLRTKRHPEDREGAIGFGFEALRPGYTLIGPERNVRFRISETRWFWATVGSAILGYVLFGFIASSGLETLWPAFDWPTAWINASKLVAEFGQLGMLFYLFRALGYRFM